MKPDYGIQWKGLKKKDNNSIQAFFERVDKSKFGKNNDNLAYDLTLQGCLKRNEIVKTHEKTYYFSYITEQTTKISDSTGESSWDHGDIVFTVNMEPRLIEKKENWYRRLYERLASLD